MVGSIHEVVPGEGFAIATSGGAYSANTRKEYGRIMGVRVRPLTATTIYDVSILDKDSFVIYQRQGIKGAFSEDLAGCPIVGILTCAIANATANEAFTYKLLVEGM